MAPKFVAPYRLSGARGKNDAADAAAICEAVRWAIALAERRGYWTAVVAIAAKNARMAWAVLDRGERFRMPA